MNRIPYINDEENFTLEKLSDDLYENIITACGLVSDYCEIDQNNVDLREMMMSLIDKSFEKISDEAQKIYFGNFCDDYISNMKVYIDNKDRVDSQGKRIASDAKSLADFNSMVRNIIDQATRGLYADIQRIKANLQPFLTMKAIDQDTYGTPSQPIM